MSEYITAKECRESEPLILEAYGSYFRSLHVDILTPMILKLEKELDLCQKKKTQ